METYKLVVRNANVNLPVRTPPIALSQISARTNLLYVTNCIPLWVEKAAEAPNADAAAETSRDVVANTLRSWDFKTTVSG